jgi:molybdate transport system ATP-binding protein
VAAQELAQLGRRRGVHGRHRLVQQQQRVAITRALASEPELLLLDEPMAAVDAAATTELRQFLRRHLARFAGPTVLVTHEPLDALVLCDQVVVLDAGRAVQTGPPAEVTRRPRSPHVAALMGLNLLRGHADGEVVQLPGGQRLVLAHALHGDVFASFRPSAVTVHPTPPYASARNVWPGRIAGVTPHGDVVRLHIDGPVPLVADITQQAMADLRLGQGQPMWAAVKAVEVAAYPA